MDWLTILIGLLGGVAVGTQTPIINQISQRIGVATGSIIVHISGALVSVLLLIVRGGEALQDWRTLPWWMYGVGGFGVLLFLTINYTIPRIGAAAAIALVIAGQLMTGLVIDQLGLFGAMPRSIDLGRLAGLALLLAGGYLIAR